MKVSVYNQKGEEVKKIDLSKNVFGMDFNHDLVHQVVTCQASNRRQGSAHTKDRSEVRGGGRKPWRQKGTGRARHGSIRSPLFKGGGVTFGPRNEKNYKKIIPEKMRKKALSMVLSEKLKDKELIFIEDINVKEPKTKLIENVLNNFSLKEKKTLILCPEGSKNTILSARNLFKTETLPDKDINALDALSFKFLVIPEKSVKIIENILK